MRTLRCEDAALHTSRYVHLSVCLSGPALQIFMSVRRFWTRAWKWDNIIFSSECHRVSRWFTEESKSVHFSFYQQDQDYPGIKTHKNCYWHWQANLNQTIQYWKVLLLSISLELVVLKLEEFQWKTFSLWICGETEL